ncbi:ankyrin repeat-containing protein At5g02620-like [Coffea eugenioides]|uniref:ankyrin repeat-containing protein At5g02620-like n=1 Tax=Coffea eugenioides TaxID=49369 RepID=UPI000F60EA82|nr:ankyrin repeat-containing protein At5g02620-like [Coffea eugenioides]
MDPELYAAAQSGNWVVMKRFSDYFYSQHTPVKDTVLHVLAESCDSANVVQLILAKHGRLLMKLNKRGETALHLAARNGHLGIVRALIDYAKSEAGHGFPPCFDRRKRMLRMASVAGNTALYEAVWNNFYDIAKLLVQEDPEFRYPHNHAVETPLYLAVEKGRHNIMVLILESCKTPSYLGPGDKTALHAASILNLPESMKLILEKLPNLIKNVDKFGWTALHYAAKFDHQEIARLLLSADRSAAYVAAKNDDSKTALHIAVIHGHVVLVREILSHGADCWVQITGESQNILHLAVKHEKGEVLEFVLQNSWASELINQQDNEGNTPLHLYVATKNLDGNCLVNHPFVDVNSFDDSNSTPLDKIVENDQLSERQILIKVQLEQAGGTRGYRNVATVEKILRAFSSPDEVKRVEQWSKNYSIVATLIITVTFAAGFTVPGGYNSDGPHKGMAVLGKKAAFIGFVILDSLAMFASIAAVLGHIMLMVTKNYRLKLAVVLAIVVEVSLALGFMTGAFLFGLYAVLPHLTVRILMGALYALLGLHIFIYIRLVRSPTKSVSSLLGLHSHMLHFFARKRGQGMYSEADSVNIQALGLYKRYRQDLTEAED